MKTISIESTAETPEISFDVNGNLAIKGISTPSNVNNFYQPIFDWINQFKMKNPKKINLELCLDYINTSSSRILVELISLIKSFKNLGTAVNFVWVYENDDEDMLEMGEEFAIVTNTNFVYKGTTSLDY